MVPVQRTFARLCFCNRNTKPGCNTFEALVCSGIVDAAAGNQQRSLGCGKHFNCLLQGVHIRPRAILPVRARFKKRRREIKGFGLNILR